MSQLGKTTKIMEKVAIFKHRNLREKPEWKNLFVYPGTLGVNRKT